MSSNTKIELYKAGITQYAQQDFAASLETFQQALVLDPEFGDVHQAIAHVYEKMEDFDNALASAQKAVECNPDDFLAHTSLSMFYQRKGMIPEAESEKAIAAQLQQDQPQ
jgi:tetratricopeptide (TPR) repeat protein